MDMFSDEELYALENSVIDDDITPGEWNVEENCKHEVKIEAVAGISICQECGMSFEELSYDDENRKSSAGGTSSRCGSSVSSGTSLRVELCRKNIPEAIANLTAKLFDDVRENKTYRNKNRQGHIGAALIYASGELGEPYDIDEVCKLLEVDKKKITSGKKEICIKYKKFRTWQMEPKHYIKRILKHCNIDLKHEENIRSFIRHLEKSSKPMVRCQPKSIAASLIYLYMVRYAGDELKRKNLTKTDFAVIIDISEMTITKIVKEASKKLKK